MWYESRRPRRVVWTECGIIAVAVSMLAAAAPAAGIGIQTTFTELLERQQARADGRRLHSGLDPNFPSPFLDDADMRGDVDIIYSPWTDVVYELSGPGWFRSPPEHYLTDGAYLTYDPDDYSDPSIHLGALRRDADQRQRLAAAERGLYESRRGSSFSAEKKALFTPGSGINLVVPIHMKGPLSEFFGRGATNIKVTGRENIAFAGESRRVSPFIETERGRGQGL